MKFTPFHVFSDSSFLCSPPPQSSSFAVCIVTLFNFQHLQGAALESTNASRIVPETSFAPSHPLPTKVSSIYTTNENKGVSITRSHEVHGKSSTDGTSSTAGRSGNLSLDDVEKIKKALQKQKELSEKLKKIPQVLYSHKFVNASHLFVFDKIFMHNIVS